MIFKYARVGKSARRFGGLLRKTLSPFTDDGSVSGNKPEEEQMRRMILWRSSPRLHTFPRGLCGAWGDIYKTMKQYFGGLFLVHTECYH